MHNENIQSVREFYNSGPEGEWNRLDREPFEFELTTGMMDRYIRPGDSILDIGGGPGRYAIYYAKKGCDVTLTDLSDGCIALAEKKAALSGLQLKAHAINCLELDELDLGQFDHVLLMGPLYHLVDKADRVEAVQIALRHLKPGGKLYASFIQTIAGLLYCLQNDGMLPKCLHNPEDQRQITAVEAGTDWGGAGFCEYTYMYDLKNIAPFMAQFPLQQLHLFGQESFLSPNKAEILKRSPEEIQAWMELAKRYLEQPSFLSWAEHILYIGEKING